MSQVADQYQCPNCNGPLHFDPNIQKLKCDYCDSTFDRQEVEQFYDTRQNQKTSLEDEVKLHPVDAFEENDQEDLAIYHCPNCNANISAPKTRLVTTCPYCNNNLVLNNKFESYKKPERLIPFTLSKEQAISSLKEFYKGKPLLPKTFREKAKVDSLKAIYVPYFLYDGSVYADAAFHCTRAISHREGDYIVTRTSHYQVIRKGTLSFEEVPIDASIAMDDSYMDALEPYDYTLFEPFSTMYMAGYLADLYDEDEGVNANRAQKRMEQSTRNQIMATVFGYTSVLPERFYLNYHSDKIQFVYLPVYLLNVTYKKQNYLFAINGTNGKVAGKLPSDTVLFLSYFIGLGLLFFLIALAYSGVLKEFFV